MLLSLLKWSTRERDKQLRDILRETGELLRGARLFAGNIYQEKRY